MLRLKPLALLLAIFGAFWSFEAFPALDKERWCKVTTSQFDLYGYLPKNRLQSLADSLLAFNAVSDQYMPGERISGHRLRVVAFRNQKEFIDVFQAEKFIGFMYPSLRQHLLAFVLDERDSRPLMVAYHEYAHFLARSRLSIYVPLWYEEGFAQFVSTVDVRRDRAFVGEIPLRRLSRAVRRNADNIDKILNSTPPFDWGRHEVTDNYLIAWAVTHMLFLGVDESGKRLRENIPQLLERISTGTKTDQALLDLTGTDKESFVDLLRKHLSRSRTHEEIVQIPNVDNRGKHEVVCLNSYEKKVLLGEILINHNPVLAQEYLNEAQEEAPYDPDLLVSLSRANANDYQRSYALAKDAYDRDNQHVEANIRVADLLTWPCLLNPGERCQDYLHLASQFYLNALTNASTRVDAAFGLGVVYLELGRAGDGLNYLRVAHQRAPWSPRTNLFLGEAYGLIGDYQRAESHLTKAVLWETQDAWRSKAQESLDATLARMARN